VLNIYGSNSYLAKKFQYRRQIRNMLAVDFLTKKRLSLRWLGLNSFARFNDARPLLFIKGRTV
jgi:hypothetical protein